MDLGLKGSCLAGCLAELESKFSISDSKFIEFSTLIIIYSRHSGLRIPSSYKPSEVVDSQSDTFWVPSYGGKWVEVKNSLISFPYPLLLTFTCLFKTSIHGQMHCRYGKLLRHIPRQLTNQW